MEQEIILEGIHAMLEEIRDNLKKNPELETIKLKLGTIEKVCNEFTGQKFVTEEIMAQFLACTLQKVAEMNKKQEEKIERVKECILGHHKYVKEYVYELQKNTVVSLETIYELLKRKPRRMNLFEKIFKF